MKNVRRWSGCKAYRWANPGTKVADHVATILLMLAARDPVAAMIARNLNRPKPSRADEPDERSRPGDSS